MHPFNPADAYARLVREAYHGDLAAVDELIAPQFRMHMAGAAAGPLVGPEGFRAVLAGARSPFSSLEFRIAVGPLVQGDLLAARWQAEGVYAGGFAGAKAPAGTPVSFGGHDFFRFAEGRFVEFWGGADDSQVMQQLGMFS